jgi:hypothetical protein
MLNLTNSPSCHEVGIRFHLPGPIWSVAHFVLKDMAMFMRGNDRRSPPLIQRSLLRILSVPLRFEEVDTKQYDTVRIDCTGNARALGESSSS